MSVISITIIRISSVKDERHIIDPFMSILVFSVTGEIVLLSHRKPVDESEHTDDPHDYCYLITKSDASKTFFFPTGMKKKAKRLLKLNRTMLGFSPCSLFVY
jgi:hypothetical protein